MTSSDALVASPASSPPTKASLTSWWERFRKKNGSGGDGKGALQNSLRRTRDVSWFRYPTCTDYHLAEAIGEQQGIFGVPLDQSIKYANVAINVTDSNGESQVYGYVPVVVAKCGVYLKEKGTSYTPLPLPNF